MDERKKDEYIMEECIKDAMNIAQSAVNVNNKDYLITKIALKLYDGRR